MTRRAALRPPTVLAYSEDEGVLACVRSLMAEEYPQAELYCAQRVEDAVSQGTAMVVDLALLDQSNSQRLSPLIRLLRGRSSRVKVVVFGDPPEETRSRITRWSELGDIVWHTLQHARMPADQPGP